MAKSDRASPMGLTTARRRVERATVPAWVKPQLAALVKTAPDGPEWLHEIKLDGYRMQARLDTFLGTKTEVPQGGVIWVFALRN